MDEAFNLENNHEMNGPVDGENEDAANSESGLIFFLFSFVCSIHEYAF